ncbi:sigma-54-dependent Fis family transcriptional regulator [Sphingomonas sp.]|uniref:sigma-54 interaction domain-containing protein n=1 Tax=Sphingomonas sp. TaxID=28214 RepID=UPI0025E056DF|nr:sigma-54 dependent transcriptional regulator [Sphingomonas sp.]
MTTATKARPPSADDLLLGTSPPMQAVRALVARVAPRDVSVLITGPSGSGKERAAQAIHMSSDRRDGPFVAINCGAIPRDLLESELFGHEKGSFTGAHATRIGRFEEASGGTLFLDEIGDMPHDMQVKLLRVLEERVVERVGGRTKIAVDVRILSATHRNLETAIDDGIFREDLYYRLAVFPIALPALAERTGDLPLLIDHFLKIGGDRRGAVKFTGSGIARLSAHRWPGNLRELRNLVERAAILHPAETIGGVEVDRLLSRAAPVLQPTCDAPTPRLPPPTLSEGTIDLREILAELEGRYIREAIERSSGVIAEAARSLGLNRTTLIEKMRRYAA